LSVSNSKSLRMLALRTLRTFASSPAAPLRVLSTTRPSFNEAESRNPQDRTPGMTDVQGDSIVGGKKAADSPPSGPQPVDSATHSKGGKSAGGQTTAGNKAGVGMVDQVGGTGQQGQSEVGGKEEATPPGLWKNIKKGLGLETTPEDVKQNRGGGSGVTGTGSPKE